MTHELPLKGGDEQDALTRWRKVLYFPAGARKRIKRKYNKRVRYLTRAKLRATLESPERYETTAQ